MEPTRRGLCGGVTNGGGDAGCTDGDDSSTGDHAGELETSVMMEITPELVLPLSEAGKGDAKTFKIDGLKTGLAWAPRNWRKVTEDTGSGDPSRATREKGVRHLEAVTTAIADYLVQLAKAESPDSYE